MTEPANGSNLNASNSSIPIVIQGTPPSTSSSSSRKRSAPLDSNDSNSEGDNINNGANLRASSSEAEPIEQPPRSRPRIQRVSVETLYRQLESRFSNDDVNIFGFSYYYFQATRTSFFFLFTKRVFLL